ncbi:MAG: hypothetical protein J5529_10875 [Prevotella sp.]|nr:hypothetical protein [Prevotella sp.]
MKKILFTILLALVAMTVDAKTYLYDVNKDGIVNVTDVTFLVNHILGVPNEGEENNVYDVDGDGVTNVADVTFLVNNILGVPNPKEGLCPDNNHPHLIDLGLPSGTEWSCCNVGADAPESFGCYYAWGETEEKEWYDKSNYNSLVGASIDPDNISGTAYDVAYQTLGNVFMPTRKQAEELLENCTSEWMTINGIPGLRVLAPNREAIFLPAAGTKDESGLYFDGRAGCYWLSKAADRDMSWAYSIYFMSSRRPTIPDDYCYHGSSVRPVSLPQLKLSTSTLYIGVGQSRRVQIKSGSGNYTVETSNFEAASASLEENSFVVVYGRGHRGNMSATITVTDTEFGQTATIDVIIVDNLEISENELSLALSCEGTVEITSGTGNYTVESRNKDVATARLEDNSVIVKGVGVGETNITVTDLLTDQSKNISVSVFIESILTCPNDNHPHLIDLGLPSRTLWSCCNVGATAPEGYGGYYSWGETTDRNCYDWTTYTLCHGKYGTCFNLGDDIAGTRYDVAHVTWGSSWVMPSYEQFKELFDNTTREWIALDGMNMLKLTGSNNGVIYLPYAGYKWGYDCEEENNYAAYWTSIPYPSNSNKAYSFSMYAGDNTYSLDEEFRYSGLSVRPVFK